MIDLLKLMASYIPEDPENKPGLFIFELPDRCSWMASIFEYHDNWYKVGPSIGMRLSEIDWRIFKGLTIKAEEPSDWMERCHRAQDICTYWSIMRSAGHYLYNRHGVK